MSSLTVTEMVNCKLGNVFALRENDSLATLPNNRGTTLYLRVEKDATTTMASISGEFNPIKSTIAPHTLTVSEGPIRGTIVKSGNLLFL